LREVYKNYSRFKSMANKLKKHVLKNFDSDAQHELFASSVLELLPPGDSENWLAEIENIVKEYE